ncbi:hypothetical protein AGMMS50229_19500 [Campylobacterota bacterium]|nr:hypothetical protein AGMMS50229_19500 [Campylobacterota bacterium]
MYPYLKLLTGDDEWRFGKNGVNKFGKGVLKFFERDFVQNASQRGVAGSADFPESQELGELCRMQLDPAFDFGDGGDVGEEAGKNDGQSGDKGLRNAAF